MLLLRYCVPIITAYSVYECKNTLIIDHRINKFFYPIQYQKLTFLLLSVND